MKRTTILAAIAVTGTAAAALAHGGATGVVKERMEAMMAMGDAVKTVTPMMQGEAEYEAEVMREAARTFQAHSGEALTDLFPEGSAGAVAARFIAALKRVLENPDINSLAVAV